MTHEKIQNKIAYLYMKYIITKRPLDINIETITMCPLKCIFCCNRIYKRDYTIMNNKHFEKLIQEYIKIGGGVYRYRLYAVRFSFRSFIDG